MLDQFLIEIEACSLVRQKYLGWSLEAVYRSMNRHELVWFVAAIGTKSDRAWIRREAKKGGDDGRIFGRTRESRLADYWFMAAVIGDDVLRAKFTYHSLVQRMVMYKLDKVFRAQGGTGYAWRAYFNGCRCAISGLTGTKSTNEASKILLDASLPAEALMKAHDTAIWCSTHLPGSVSTGPRRARYGTEAYKFVMGRIKEALGPTGIDGTDG